MNIRKLMLSIVFLLVNSPLVYANSVLGQHESECYSVAMVGYDSVINYHLGVPLDQVINTFVEGNANEQTLEIYRDYLLTVVMGAYQWDGTPHTYAVKTIYDCAARHAEVAMH